MPPAGCNQRAKGAIYCGVGTSDWVRVNYVLSGHWETNNSPVILTKFSSQLVMAEFDLRKEIGSL